MVSVDHTLAPKLCWEICFVKAFIGRRQLQIQQNLCKSVTINKDVQGLETTFIINLANSVNMALAEMGNGHNWSDAPSPRKLEICRSSSWILLQVDWSISFSHNNFGNNPKILLAKYHMLIRSPEIFNCWQWHAIWLWSIQSVLQSGRYCHALCFGQASRI